MAKDVQYVGSPNLWRVIQKVWSDAEGWTKTTSAMQLNGGVLVQTAFRQINPDKSHAVSESLLFLANKSVAQNTDGTWSIID